MKKLISILIMVMLFTACVHPILKRNEYNVIDTTYVNKTGAGTLLGYNVIVKIDSSYFSGTINKNGELTHLIRKLNHIKQK